MKAYYAKRDLPRLFVSKVDADIDNIAASVVLMTDYDIGNCEELYIYVEGVIGEYKDSPFLTVQEISRLYPAHLSTNVDSLSIDGAHCPND